MPLYALTPELVASIVAEFPGGVSSLDLAGNCLEWFDGASLSALSPQLTQLSLARCGLRGLRGLEELEGLTSLDVSHNSLQEAEALAAALRRLPRLAHLRLEGNPACAALAATLERQLPWLETLDGRAFGAQARAAAAEGALAETRAQLAQAAADAQEARQRAEACQARAAECERRAAEAELCAGEAQGRADASDRVQAQQLDALSGGDAGTAALLRRWRGEAREALASAAGASERELATAKAAHAQRAAAEQQTRLLCEGVAEAMAAMRVRAAAMEAECSERLTLLERRVQAACRAAASAGASSRERCARDASRAQECEDALSGAVARAGTLHSRLRQQTALLEAMRCDAAAACSERDAVLRRADAEAQAQAHVLVLHSAALEAARRDARQASTDAAAIKAEAQAAARAEAQQLVEQLQLQLRVLCRERDMLDHALSTIVLPRGTSRAKEAPPAEEDAPPVPNGDDSDA